MQSRLTGGLPAKLSQGPRTGYDLSRMGAGAARGANRKKKLEAAPWSGTWPAPQATLDLDFANNRGFVRGLGQGGVMDGITFTRASNGTFVGPDGLLKGYTQGINNLLTFPQDFDNAAWTKNESTVSQNVAVAPNGTLTADALIESANNARHGVSQFAASASATINSFSVSAKANTRSWLGIRVDGVTSYFDLGSGVVGTAGAGCTLNISEENGGWYRCTVTKDWFANNNCWLIVASADNTEIYTGNGTSGIFIWGAQLELGSTATEYFPTNINVPRFDWAGTEVVANKNLAPNTEAFNAWTNNGNAVTVTANGDTAPDGTQTADLLSQSAVSGAGRWISPINLTSIRATTVTLSVWLRKVSGVNSQPTISLSNINTGNSSSALSVTGTWTRFSFTTTTSSSGDSRMGLQIDWSSSGAANDNVFAAWGFQVELGDTATDYQPIAQPTTNTPLRPAPTCNGLLIEEARTNRLLWCRDATQTQWVKTDITAAKDQTGIDGVANAASSLTATADGGTCIQTITLASGSRTGSVYLKRLTGTGAVQESLDGSTWSTVDLSTDEWRRIVLSGTVTNPVVGIRLAVSGDAVAMDFGQVEDGAFVTSPVLTTGATATRSAEFASTPVVITSQFYDQNKGSLFVKAFTFMPTSLGATAVVVGTEGAGSSLLHFEGGKLSNNNVPGAGFNTANTIPAYSNNQIRSVCYSWINGSRGTLAANQSFTSSPSAGWVNIGRVQFLRQLFFGVATSSFWLNGCISRVGYAPVFSNDVAALGVSNSI
jgi:hypothetical protein